MKSGAPIKVALIDNMNNNFFALGRYLRDLGLDVDLYEVPNALPHFRPQCDTFDDVSSMDWIKMFPYSTRYRDWIFST
ncbi:MAG: hypothetical protein D6732_03485, partial [Methanobacteriota archaeon]